jgi:hypothetical protein
MPLITREQFAYPNCSPIIHQVAQQVNKDTHIY